jgi:hypothetical protein
MVTSLPFLSSLPAYVGQFTAAIPVILIIVGILTFFYAVIRQRTPEKPTPLETFIGVITFIIGLLLPIGAGLCILFGVYGVFTAILLVVLSISLVWGPIARVLKRIPTLALVVGISLALSCIIVVAVVYLIPIPAIIQPYIAPYLKWIIIGLFIVIALLSFTMILFAKGLVELFGLIFGSWPVMIVIGIICIIQGALLVFGMSLTQFVEGIIYVPW